VGGDTSWVRGWIGLSGPYALETSRFRILQAIFSQPYSAADWQPVALVNGPSPPALLLHGADDYMVPPLEAMKLEQKLRAAGVRVECHIYNGTAHGDVLTAFSLLLRAEAPSLTDVSRFIDGTLAAPRLARSEPGTPCPAVLVTR
jgi:acetyl esterase/lipase